jgi:T5SS/PEP-CTERM-associated repeat protein
MCTRLTVSHDRFGARFVSTIALILAATLMSTERSQAVHIWVGPAAGGDFHNPANWHTNTSPVAGDFPIIGPVNGTITHSASTALLQQTFFTEANAHTILDIGAGQSHSTSALFIVGSDNPNRDLTIPNGTLNVGTTMFVGSGILADNCDVVISGANTLVNTSEAGVNSGGIFVGVGGDNATLTIKEGADVVDDNPLAGLIGVGFQRTNNGLLTVTDAGSTLTTVGPLQVGTNNNPGNPDMFNNQAKVLNGGSLTAGRLQVGILESGKQNTVTVSGAGSMMTLTSVGIMSPIGWRSINNSLIVENDGLVDNAGSFVLGLEATSTGNALSVTSGGQINAAGLDVRRGTATVTEGTLIVDGALVANTGATSVVNFNSGTVEAVSADINNGSTFNVGDGGGNSATYRMVQDGMGNNGAHSFANGLFLNSNAVLEGSGDITGNVSAAAGAQVNVGSSPGLMTVAGNWDNTGVALGIEIGDLSASSLPGVGYDQLDIDGAFTHGGSVVIDVSSFVPFVKEVKLVGWTSEVGSTANTAVSFAGGPALNYAFRSDGLYVTNIPEPNSLVIVFIGLSVGLVARRSQR